MPLVAGLIQLALLGTAVCQEAVCDAAGDKAECMTPPVFSLDEISKNNSSNLMDALHNVGCFYLADHGIPPEVVQEVMAALETFFALPKEQKSDVAIDRNQRGWLDSTSSKSAKMHFTNISDHKEILFFGPDLDANDPDIGQKPMLAVNRWPDKHMPDLKAKVYAYYDRVMKIGEAILQAIAIGLGLSDHNFFKKFYDKPMGRGQLLYYPVPTRRDEQIYAVGPHFDLGAITVVLQDDNGGLQFFSRRSQQWIDVKPVKNTLVINIGNILKMWTAGFLQSTIHRVVNGNRSRHRYGVSIFYDPSSDALIDPHDVFGDPGGHREVVVPFYAGQYIANSNRKLFSHYEDEGYDLHRQPVETQRSI